MIKIKVKELVNKLDLEVLTAGDLDREVTGGYCCDLLSNVMARAKAGDIWLTLQGHQNIVAVASLTDVAAILVVEDFEVDDSALKKADTEGINILRSSVSAYQLAGQIFAEGV